MSAYQNLNQYFRCAGVQYENTFTPITNSGQSGHSQSGGDSSSNYDNSGYNNSNSGYDPNQLASIAYPSAIDNTSYSGSKNQGPSNQQAAQQQLGYINYNNDGQPSTSGYTDSYTNVVQNYAASTMYSANETPMGGLNLSSNSNTRPVYSSRPTEWNRRYSTTNWRDRKSSGHSCSTSNKPQMFYCETCKISCAGPESFAEHSKGKKHLRMEKEKNDSTKSKAIISPITIHCKICDVPCTGRDAYEAHLKGSKHQKVIELLHRLGKPIPQLEPLPPLVPVFKSPDNSRIKVLGTPKINFSSGGRLHTTQVGGIILPVTDLMDESVPANLPPPMADNGSSENVSKVETVPKVVYVKPKEPDPVGEDHVETIKGTNGSLDTYYCKLCDCNFNDDASKHAHVRGRRHRLSYKKKIDPKLVVDIKPSDLKTREKYGRSEDRYKDKRIQKNTPGSYGGTARGSKEITDRYGRPSGGNPGHSNAGRYQYPGPQYVEPMPPMSQNFGARSEYGMIPYAGFGPMPPPPDRYSRMAEPYLSGPYIPPPQPCPPSFGPPSSFGLPFDSPYEPRMDQRMYQQQPEPEPMTPLSRGGPYPPIPVSAYNQVDHVLTHKETQLRPSEDESDDIYHQVAIVEKALKLVSDKLIEEDVISLVDEVLAKKFNPDAEEEREQEEEETSGQSEIEKARAELQSKRALKGLQRVGPISNDLLLPGESVITLVVICGEKPTRELLQRVGTKLPWGLEESAPTEPYEVVIEPQEAAIAINSTVGRKLTVRISLTSPLMREPIDESQESVKESKYQLLDRSKCLESLASLRHTKWYQACLAHLHPAPIVIRILRNMITNVDTWSCLTLWTVQLLVERIITSAGEPLTPGQCLRHVFESITGGLFLPGSPGIVDPCEKDQTDAIGYLDRQQRENLTTSAQHALRLMAFKQFGKLLSVNLMAKETLPAQKRRSETTIEEVQMETDAKVAKVADE